MTRTETYPPAGFVAGYHSNHGTHDGTPEDIAWFPALITEHDTGPGVGVAAV